MSELSPKDLRLGERLFLSFSPIKGDQSRALRFYNVYIQRPTTTASDGHCILLLLPPCTLMTPTNLPPELWQLWQVHSVEEVLQNEERVKEFPGTTRTGLLMRLRDEFSVECVAGWIHEELALLERAS